MKYAALIKAIHSATAQMQGRAATAVNQALVLRSWFVGAEILDFEQDGKDRAKYGERLLDKLAADLKQSGLKGLDTRTLPDCRGMVRLFPQIRGTLSPEFPPLPDSGDTALRIRQTPSIESPAASSSRPLLGLSWSLFIEITPQGIPKN